MFAASFVALWFGSAAWCFTNALRFCGSRATAHRWLLFGLFVPFVGPAIYVLLRPCETVAERRERELSIEVLERELARDERCLVCRHPIEPDYLRCPSCATPLAHACDDCGHSVRFTWACCPYCEGERVERPHLAAVV